MIDLISVDAYILRKSFEQRARGDHRNGLFSDKAIGGDPYLKVLRGNVLLREKVKLKEASEMVQNALLVTRSESCSAACKR